MAEIRRRLFWDNIPLFFDYVRNLKEADDIVHHGRVSKLQTQR
jgi:hypothetical protein